MSEQKAKLYHYYHLSFVEQGPGISQFSSHQVQLEQSHLTMPVLNSIRTALKVSPTAQLLSISYLGCMTAEEFSPPQRSGIEATDEYIEGLQVGTNAEPGQIYSNPYEPGTAQHIDWRNGRIKGEEIRQRNAEKKESL